MRRVIALACLLLFPRRAEASEWESAFGVDAGAGYRWLAGVSFAGGELGLGYMGVHDGGFVLTGELHTFVGTSWNGLTTVQVTPAVWMGYGRGRARLTSGIRCGALIVKRHTDSPGTLASFTAGPAARLTVDLARWDAGRALFLDVRAGIDFIIAGDFMLHAALGLGLRFY